MRSAHVIPVIEISPLRNGTCTQKYEVARQIDRACREIGFLIVTGHGIPEEIVSVAWQATEKYFSLPLSEKEAIPMTEDYPYGYSGIEGETLSKSRGEDFAPDLKESFCIGPYNLTACKPPIKWPEVPDNFKEAWLAYYKEMERLSTTLLRGFALALGLDENWFDDKTDKHVSAMRALHYPPLKKPPSANQMRASAHTDYGSITVLKPGGPGLQVQTRDGVWVEVPHFANAFIINLGDLMARWTNDRWVSTMHRVVLPTPNPETSQSRYSIAFFHNVNDDTVIASISTCCGDDNPPRYPPIRAGEYLMQKHRAATVPSSARRSPTPLGVPPTAAMPTSKTDQADSLPIGSLMEEVRLSGVQAIFAVIMALGFKTMVENAYAYFQPYFGFATSISVRAPFFNFFPMLAVVFLGLRYFWCVINVRRYIEQADIALSRETNHATIIRHRHHFERKVVLLHIPMLILHAVLFCFAASLVSNMIFDASEHATVPFIVFYACFQYVNAAWLWLLVKEFEPPNHDAEPPRERFWIKNNVIVSTVGLGFAWLVWYGIMSSGDGLVFASLLFILSSVIDFAETAYHYLETHELGS